MLRYVFIPLSFIIGAWCLISALLMDGITEPARKLTLVCGAGFAFTIGVLLLVLQALRSKG